MTSSEHFKPRIPEDMEDLKRWSRTTLPAGLPTPTEILPHDIFDCVLNFLPSYPWLFNAMLVSWQWHNASRANYTRRQQRVQSTGDADALLNAVAAAGPGDTIIVEGLHTLSRPLVVDKPICFIAAAGTTPTVCSSSHVLIRTRHTTLLRRLTLVRLGHGTGYPNAVVFAEAGKLLLDGCRITCGGDSSADEALRIFDGVPAPGAKWNAPPPIGHVAAQPQPQCGVWVGANSRAQMTRCMVLRTIGPGVKIYRGMLEANDSTIALARCGGGVVANGGEMRMQRNEVCGSNGHGISAWNRTQLHVTHSHIHSNEGGISINTNVVGFLTITNNVIADNRKTGIYVHSPSHHHVVEANTCERNAMY